MTRLTPRSTRCSNPLVLLVLLAAAVAPGRASAVTLFDAVVGHPEGQGWSRAEQTDPTSSIAVGLGSEGLHFSTLPLLSTGLLGGAIWWTYDGLGLDFTQDFAIEASVRIVDAPNRSINVDTGWPRPGYGIALSDVHNNFLWIGLGSSEVFLSHTAYGAYNSSNTVHAPFITTDRHHVYRIERGPGGVGAALRIDGALVLHLPTLGSPDGSAGPSLYFGDLTFWANSESHTAWVRHTSSPLAVDTAPRLEALSVRGIATPSRSPRVAYRTGLTGTMEFELFDTAGRRVDRSLRAVSAGESGVFVPAQARNEGLYFYRVRLAPSAGRAVEASGRLVVLR